MKRFLDHLRHYCCSPFAIVGTHLYLFWGFLILILLLFLTPNICSNGFTLYEHIAQPHQVMILACCLLTLAMICWGWTWYHQKLFMPRAHKLWQILGLSVLLNVCANVFIYLPDGFWLIAILSTMGTMCIAWGFVGRLSLMFWFPFLFIEMLQLGAHVQYGTQINNPIVLAEIIEATNDEIMGYLTPFNILLAFLLLGICYVICVLQKRILQDIPRLPLLNTGILLLIISSGYIHLFHPSNVSIDNLWPCFELAKYQFNIKEAAIGNDNLLKYVSDLPSPTQQPSNISTLQGDAGVVLVLHIGESVRADRLGLNGYKNNGIDTTPWLSSQQKSRRLINYSNCISSAPMTCHAMITMLTDARRSLTNNNKEYQAQAGSVLDLFTANNFSVYSFFGKASGRMVKAERVTRILTQCSKESYWAEGLPKTVIPKISNTLREHPHENLVLYINNEGSHAPFRNYDINNAVFSPSRPSLTNPAAHAQEVNNAYDNTIHYTDDFIRLVAEELQGRPFVYIYVSDHGEWLGHDGIWGRGGVKNYHSNQGSRVGMFILVSEGFETLHPHFTKAVGNLRTHADMTVGHEHLYHTLLGLIGIKSSYYESSLDLSSDSPSPYTGPQPDSHPKQ